MQRMPMSPTLLKQARAVMRAAACFGSLLVVLLPSCAHDNHHGNDEEPFPVQIDMSMILGGDPSLAATPDNWYYFIFNFGTLSPTADTKPVDEIVGVNRGKNWEMYVGFHRDKATG